MCDDLDVTDSRVRGISQVKPVGKKSSDSPSQSTSPIVSVNELSPEDAQLVQNALNAVRRSRGSLKAAIQALQVHRLARAIDAELSSSLLDESSVRRRVEKELLPSVTRTPKGPLLVEG